MQINYYKFVFILSMPIIVLSGCCPRYVGPGGNERMDNNELTPEKNREINKGESRARLAAGVIEMIAR